MQAYNLCFSHSNFQAMNHCSKPYSYPFHVSLLLPIVPVWKHSLYIQSPTRLPSTISTTTQHQAPLTQTSPRLLCPLNPLECTQADPDQECPSILPYYTYIRHPFQRGPFTAKTPPVSHHSSRHDVPLPYLHTYILDLNPLPSLQGH